jgi:hypothetical protein
MNAPVAAAWRYWFDAVIAAQAASVTVAMRTMEFNAAILEGSLHRAPEARRMVDEKVTAAAEGVRAATKKIARAAKGGPAKLAAETPAILHAASKPAFAKARANAKRLTKHRKKR